ncbi:hypothetical protein [Mycobacterium sp.]|uniref:hypothetical protein n=1 Tax=Mycobacterium sp. TaxID=1785 RepID=UPI002D8EDB08|nr:hypothetical protein [Mycobacterium sp.]
MTAVDRFQVDEVTMIEPGGHDGGTGALRDFLRDVELIESARLDLASMISRRITRDEVGEALGLPSADAVRTVVASW